MSNDGKLKILVTGGGGFIGSFLVQQLSRKHKIIILDHGNRYKILKKKIKKNVEFVIGDVTDEKILDLPKHEIPDTVKRNTGNYSNMKTDTRKKLISFYNKYNHDLFKLLNQEFDWNK